MMALVNEKCLICNRKKGELQIYFEDEMCLITDCPVCERLVVVWKVHTVDAEPSTAAVGRMREFLHGVARGKLGHTGFYFEIDADCQWKGHWSCHAVTEKTVACSMANVHTVRAV